MFQPKRGLMKLESSNESAEIRYTSLKSANPQKLNDLCKFCIEFINNDKYFHQESTYQGGLSSILRPNTAGNNSTNNSINNSMVLDVRHLLDALMKTDRNNYLRTIREFEKQPQLILSLIMHIFRNMSTCLLSEIYEDLLSLSDNFKDDSNQSLLSLSTILSVLSPPKFEITKMFLRVLYFYLKSKLVASTHGLLPVLSQSNSIAMDIAVVISPSIFKPSKSAYMSIRHIEDLRRVRPIIAFLVEKYPDIFTKDLRPIPVQTIKQSVSEDLSSKSNDGYKEIAEDFISEAPDSVKSNISIDSQSTPIIASNGYDSYTSNHNNVNMHITVSNNYVSQYSTMSPGNSPKSPPLENNSNISKVEIKVLESIVSTRITAYLKGYFERMKLLSFSYSTESPSLLWTQPDSQDDSYNATEMDVDISCNNDMSIAGIHSMSAASSVFLTSISRKDELLVTAGVYVYKTSPNSSSSQFSSSPTSSSANSASNSGGSFNDGTFGLNSTSSVSSVSSTNQDLNAAAGLSSNNSSNLKITNPLPLTLNLNIVNNSSNMTNLTGTGGSSSPGISLNNKSSGIGTALVKQWLFKREKGLRRKMIAECKVIRSQILQFEQEFKRKFGYEPKPSDRGGNMPAIYSTYRDMKRTIRDISAVDIQRHIRSYLVRVKIRRTTGITTRSSSMQPNSSSSASLSEPKMIGAVELLSQINELQIQRREIKRLLKKFDDDFTKQHGREPKKSDKEVMRPMYQNYHTIKAQIDEIQQHLNMQSAQPSNDPRIDDTVMDDDASYNYNNRVSSQSSQVDNQQVYVRADTVAEPLTEKERQLQVLQEEKKNLHVYLKTYERDFNKTHGRPVMKQEDIQPVANEYQRYKDLKTLIKDLEESK